MKYDAITGSGIEVGERVNIPDELSPPDARVEIDAKMAWIFHPGPVPDADELKKARAGACPGEQAGHPAGCTWSHRRTAPNGHHPRARGPVIGACPRRDSPGSPCDDALDGAAAAVADVTRTNYPDLAIPYHSRWRHFAAGGVDRRADLDAALADRDTASPGPRHDRPDGHQRPARRRGRPLIGVIGRHPDVHPFGRLGGRQFSRVHAAGAFSSDPADPLRVDAAGLRALDTARLAAALQVDDDNPVVGLDGRIDLLHRLGDVLGRSGDRPGRCSTSRARHRVRAHDILSYLLVSLWGSGRRPTASTVFPSVTAGRIRRCSGSRRTSCRSGSPTRCSRTVRVVRCPEVTGLDELTGLPEYRNGGLMLDTGVLRLRDPQWADRTWTPADELIVEWRGLTVALLDELAGRVCAHLGTDLPLACVLEGGTWATGRALASSCATDCRR